MSKPIIIFGTQSRAKPALDVFYSNNLTIYGLLDDDPELHQTTFYNVPILGATHDPKLRQLLKECHYFIALDNPQEHAALVYELRKQHRIEPINAIHKNATLPNYLQIGQGNFIGTGTSIGPQTTIHYHTTIHPNATIAQDVQVYEFAHIGAGAIIHPGVVIEPSAYIGAGAIILSDVRIGEGAIVAPGAIIQEDVIA